MLPPGLIRIATGHIGPSLGPGGSHAGSPRGFRRRLRPDGSQSIRGRWVETAADDGLLSSSDFDRPLSGDRRARAAADTCSCPRPWPAASR